MGSRAVGAPVRRRSRDPHPAGDHPRHRRRPHAQGSRLRSGGLSPERRARGLRRAAAHPRSDRAGRVASTRRSRRFGRTTVFTTHTPVPAGHDAFAFYMVEKHLAGCWGTLGANRDRFLALGSYDNGGGPQFNMTALALRSAGVVNAVSELHGKVTRAMWASMWPDRPRRPGPRLLRHQRRARADLDLCRIGGTLHQAPRFGLARSAG